MKTNKEQWRWSRWIAHDSTIFITVLKIQLILRSSQQTCEFRTWSSNVRINMEKNWLTMGNTLKCTPFFTIKVWFYKKNTKWIHKKKLIAVGFKNRQRGLLVRFFNCWKPRSLQSWLPNFLFLGFTPQI